MIYANLFFTITVTVRGGGSGLGRLAAWYLPGGPVGPLVRWAATSNVEVCQMTPYLQGKCMKEESERQSHKDEEREVWSGMGRG